MTRKDFELIAATLKAERPPNDLFLLPHWQRVVLSFADALRATNKQFNRDLFLRACGCTAR